MSYFNGAYPEDSYEQMRGVDSGRRYSYNQSPTPTAATQTNYSNDTNGNLIDQQAITRSSNGTAPPLPPKPPSEYTRGSTAAVDEFRHSFLASRRENVPYPDDDDPSYNNYNYPTLAHSIPYEPIERRRPSQLRGPRQPSVHSGFGYQHYQSPQSTHGFMHYDQNSQDSPSPVVAPSAAFQPQLLPQTHYDYQEPVVPQQQQLYQSPINHPAPPPPPPKHNGVSPSGRNNRPSVHMQSLIDTSYPIETQYVNAIVAPVEPEISSISSAPSSVHRTTSTNTTYSRTSNHEEKDLAPDRYTDPFVEHPTEIPLTSPQAYLPPDIQFSNYSSALNVDHDLGENTTMSFIADIREELNRIGQTPSPPKHVQPRKPVGSSPSQVTLTPSSHTPEQIGRESSLSPHTPGKEQQPGHRRTSSFKEQELERLSPRLNGGISESKFYSAYNRTSDQSPSEAPRVAASSEHIETQPSASKSRSRSPQPLRLRTVGSVPGRIAELTVPRSISTKDELFLRTGDDTLNSSMRSSSRSTADESLMNMLNLPSIPASRNRFDAVKISTREYEQCTEIWSLKGVLTWISGLKQDEVDTPLDELVKALVGLFTHHIPTLNWVRAERIATDALNSIERQGALKLDDAKLVTFLSVDTSVQGVMPLLSGNGCYSNYAHENTKEKLSYRCYSPRCSRTIVKRDNMPKVDLQSEESTTDWAAFWNISADEVSALDKRDAKRQYAIHELIVGEEGYIRDLNTLIKVYADSLQRCVPPIMKGQDEFYKNAFSSVKSLIDCNTKHLLSQFKYRQTQQGPYIGGIADIVLNWCKHAREPYGSYADSYLLADRKLRNEREMNPQFAAWFDRVSKDPRAKGAPHSFYFHRAIPRLARYGLLLKTIQKATAESDPEKQLLDRAIIECDEITGECNRRLAVIERTVELLDLKDSIRFKSSEEAADLKLSDGRRKVIRRGDVLRRGDYRVDWIPTHMLLFDNFLVLSKIRKGAYGTQYYVTKKPIPMDLLVLESVSEEAVTKSSSSKLGVGTFTNVANENGGGKRLSMLVTPASPIKANGEAVTNLGDPDKEVMFPFRVTHLGRNGKTYTLYAPSKMDRDRWRDAIIRAKREYSSSVFAMNAEPFRIKVLSEHAFGYESHMAPRLPVYAPATALDRALHDSKVQRADQPVPRPLAKSRINCGVSFVFADGRDYTLLGLDYGVFVCNNSSDRVWRRCIEVPKVTQIDVIQDLNVVVLLTEKALVYFDLDTVLSNKPALQRTISASSSGSTASQASAGYRLSKHREVGFFQVGYMKDRTLLFYKRREGISSIFKVIEPVQEKGSQRKRSKMFLSRSASIGSTEYFREVEKFYVPTESYGISLFKSSFAIHTTRGFEVMSLDVKLPQTVPSGPSITANILNQVCKNPAALGAPKIPTPESFRKRVEGTKPIGMYRVSENSLILCYEDFALFSDNHGNITGPNVIEFACKARNIALQHPYLLIFDEEMVEVRRIDKGGELRQVISGKDIRALDTRDGQIKMALAHPELAGRQLVVELIGNDFVVEDDNSSLAGL